MFAQAAADHADRPAVRMDDLVLSYAELRDAAGASCPRALPARSCTAKFSRRRTSCSEDPARSGLALRDTILTITGQADNPPEAGT